ncbi:Cu(I)-responsive transcriptional regulator [Cupriavidus taiwanensis]|uniref:Cu(I)-responsive transcriptional regulator n=1 Tax=Cupriavidus taiwanensis TaxID=164546 RepID=UPI000420AAA8|nr:Cu(I)-responsive transcriptional regulator [Cupriavidus taiwanensis]SOZ05276.1 HTH-type transcriptional regulator HmrR [Cupriavidus taiwanensis]
MNIGQAASVSGVSAKMIRYYESIGLVTSTERSAGNYRKYGEADIHTLRFIGRARAMGFPMAQIRELLGLWQNKRRASATVKAIAEQRMQELDARIAALSGMRDTLLYLSAHCEGDSRPACPILDEIGGEVPQEDAGLHTTRH